MSKINDKEINQKLGIYQQKILRKKIRLKKVDIRNTLQIEILKLIRYWFPQVYSTFPK